MAFTVHDFQDLMQLLAEHPDWRDQMRRAILDEDFLTLPQIVRDLAEEVRRLVEEVRHLAEAQRGAETQIQRLVDRVGRLDGRVPEIDYERKATAYFGRILRRAKVVERDELEELLEEHGLDGEKIDDIQLLDLVVRGKSRLPLPNGERGELWLAVEISTMLDEEDVERAEQRAKAMQEANLPTLPVVAGDGVSEMGQATALARKVVMLVGGRQLVFFEEALQHLA